MTRRNLLSSVSLHNWIITAIISIILGGFIGNIFRNSHKKKCVISGPQNVRNCDAMDNGVTWCQGRKWCSENPTRYSSVWRDTVLHKPLSADRHLNCLKFQHKISLECYHVFWADVVFLPSHFLFWITVKIKSCVSCRCPTSAENIPKSSVGGRNTHCFGKKKKPWISVQPSDCCDPLLRLTDAR